MHTRIHGRGAVGWGGEGARRGEDRHCVTRKKTQGHISFLCSLSYPLIAYKYTKYIECSEVTYKHKNQKPIQTKTYQRERETWQVASVLIRCTLATFPFLHHNLPLTCKDREWTWLPMISAEGSKTWYSHCYKLDFAAANFHIFWICHISFHTERNLPQAGVSGRKGLQFRHSLQTEGSQSQRSQSQKKKERERKKEKKRTRLE